MPRTTARRAHGEDAVLARIIAGLSIPASELDAAGPAHAAPGEIAAVDAKPTRSGRGRHDTAPTPAPTDEPLTPAERRAADRKAAAATKAIVARKAAAEEKAAADKEAAKEAAAERKAARSNPARIWVQVAGGANADDLPKAWAAVKKKAPDVFAGHGGWKTPLRATNRVLAGPFKTDADARAFVNSLKKNGVSGFTFTSDAGQKVEKLPAE
ncbi:SPOR domain-containing protein [Sphingomonas bacterium]|uniref:SPOR domain-containing protein n=1 Tax=Sphingomonas bacterium TaxID=1895847 RepID=UPI001576B68E|nr:SPOR domain-containing protein [Sphingomonas bacterium]